MSTRLSPGTRTAKLACGCRNTFLSASRFPGRSGSRTLVASCTRRKPAGSPRGETSTPVSSLPVAIKAKGARARIASASASSALPEPAPGDTGLHPSAWRAAVQSSERAKASGQWRQLSSICTVSTDSRAASAKARRASTAEARCASPLSRTASRMPGIMISAQTARGPSGRSPKVPSSHAMQKRSADSAATQRPAITRTSGAPAPSEIASATSLACSRKRRLYGSKLRSFFARTAPVGVPIRCSSMASSPIDRSTSRRYPDRRQYAVSRSWSAGNSRSRRRCRRSARTCAASAAPKT